MIKTVKDRLLWLALSALFAVGQGYTLDVLAEPVDEKAVLVYQTKLGNVISEMCQGRFHILQEKQTHIYSAEDTTMLIKHCITEHVNRLVIPTTY
jgi:hypothetical protein